MQRARKFSCLRMQNRLNPNCVEKVHSITQTCAWMSNRPTNLGFEVCFGAPKVMWRRIASSVHCFVTLFVRYPRLEQQGAQHCTVRSARHRPLSTARGAQHCTEQKNKPWFSKGHRPTTKTEWFSQRTSSCHTQQSGSRKGHRPTTTIYYHSHQASRSLAT